MTTVGPNNHHDKWVAALEAKFEGKGNELTKKEFDELLGSFDVSTTYLSEQLPLTGTHRHQVASDFPSSIFYKELMTAYPSARIILTTRSEDAWFESIAKTLHLAYTKAQAEPSKLAKMYNLHLWGDDFLAHGREAFRTHNEGVMKAAAEQGREVLLFDPSHGWDSLCKFLEKPVPQGVAYPWKDMWKGYKQMMEEVEAGRLTESSVAKEEYGVLMPSFVKEGIKAAYIYTQ